MGKMKDKVFDVLDMLANGYDNEDISLMLDVDLDFIKSIIGTPQTSEITNYYGEFNE
jgi:hypothetical protein